MTKVLNDMQNHDSVHSTNFVINNLLKIDDLNVIQPKVNMH